MASQRNHDQQQHYLKKVGLEGFALIDDCHGRNRRSSQKPQSSQPQVHQSQYQYSYYQNQQSYVFQVPQVYTVTKELAIITQYYHGAISQQQHQYCGGGGRRMSSNVSVAKDQYSDVVSSNEAARFYGGTMIVDYSKSKPLRRPY